eukprot:TRINITY_DN4542_c0_g2_i1.p1 TRINITY_DN4542_c0_g2~~TRINITY_DN4542_c0_g2_i1.p1  ORF type:complete len:121 (-),score=30.84 TRINITY_DN4542_c0_g2_i1:48-410(-)
MKFLNLILCLSVSIAQSDKSQKERLSNKEKFLLFGLGNDENNDVILDFEERKEKSLLNTFPFIQQKNSGHTHSHGHDHGNHQDHGTHDDHAELSTNPIGTDHPVENSSPPDNQDRETLYH